jgi:serine/threonine-protein kinase HSL1 (negative regulator of Swe1 kinase)
MPDIEYSTSDYHHVRPQALTKTYSTRQFPHTKSKGYGRQISRFTVISNVAETEQSYDPFKASRPQHLDSMRGADGAKVTIHRTRASTRERGQDNDGMIGHRQFSRTSGSLASGSVRGKYPKLAPPRPFASRSSLASSTRSRNSPGYMRVPIRNKRGVSFSQLRTRSGGDHGYARGLSAGTAGNYIEVNDGGSYLHSIVGSPSAPYIRSRKGHSIVPQPLLSATKPSRSSQLWTDDVRQLSSSLAKDCDEAFNRSSVISNAESQRRNSEAFSCFGACQPVAQPATPVRTRESAANQRYTSLHNRPLPAPPIRSDSVKMELMEARVQAELRKTTGGDESPGYLDRMVSHIDRLIQPLSPVGAYSDHRASSAPMDGMHATSIRPLPSIYEARKEEESPQRPPEFDRYSDQNQKKEAKVNRIASAPEPRNSSRNRNRHTRPDSNTKDTIRVVNPPSPQSPVPMPAPLTIRKKTAQGIKVTTLHSAMTQQDNGGNSATHRRSGLELSQQYRAEAKQEVAPDTFPMDESDDKSANGSNSGTIVKKKSTWFKRSSRSGDEHDWRMSIGGGHPIPSHSSSNDTAPPQSENPLPFLAKKKGFSLGRLFKKRPSNTDMTLGGKYMQPISAAVHLHLSQETICSTIAMMIRVKMPNIHLTSDVRLRTKTLHLDRSSPREAGSQSFSMSSLP